MYKGKYVIAIVLARAGSSRLKHKMLLPFLEFETVFEAVLHRVFKCNLIDEIIFATSKNPLDDKLVEIAIKQKLKVFRGSENDVVGRMWNAGKLSSMAPQVVVRVCSDNPLLMPLIVDEAIVQLIETQVDIITPFEFNTYPFGFSSVVMTFGCLARIDSGSRASIYREHVENFCFDHKEKFSVGYQKAPDELTYPELCLTLDYEIDYDRLVMYGRAIFNERIEEQPSAVIEKCLNAHIGVIGFDKESVRSFLPSSVTLFDEEDDLTSRELDLIFSFNPPTVPPKSYPSRGIIWPGTYSGELLCGHKAQEPFVVFKIEPDFHANKINYFVRMLSESAQTLLAGPLRPIYAQHRSQEKTLKRV